MRIPTHGLTGAGLGAVLLPLLGLALAAPARASEVDKLAPSQRVSLQKLPGQVLAQAVEPRPVGPFKASGYRLELVSLAEPITLGEGASMRRLDRIWRLTVTGGPFMPTSLPWQLWVDGKPLGIAQESADLSEISALIVDPTPLIDQATIAVSRGDTRRHALAAKLALPLR